MTGTSNIKTGLRAVISIAVLAAALVLPAQAFAQNDCSNVGSDPTAAQYCPPSDVQVGDVNTQSNPNPSNNPSSASVPSGTAAVTTSNDGGSLPFTGLDVGILLLVATVLTGTGLALRRLTASRHES
ncbi:MAG TPA: hypothetical protein VF176_00705 [Solirubrobacterales bacterium]